jgi:hypothetical protein
LTTKLAALYLLALTGPAHGVDCGRAITQFQFKAEDLKTLVMQADTVVTAIQASPTNPPNRAVLDWLIPFAMSIEAARSLLTVYKLAPECFNISTRDIENGIAERERILNTVANIVRGQMKGMRPP